MGSILHSQDGEDVLAHVAGNLRALRAAAGLSQAQVAERAGLSRRMLVALEAGDTNVSLAKLSGVAQALGVSFPRLVQPPATSTRPPDQAPDQAPDKAPDKALLWRGTAPESRALLLAAASGARDPEFWLWSMAPGERYPAEPDPPGWREAIFVTAGVLSVTKADGDETVAAGGFTLFRSDQAYAYANPGTELLSFLRVVLG